MKLEEIIKIVSQPVSGIDLTKFKNFKVVKKDYLSHYQVEQGEFEDNLIFVVKKQETIIGAILTIKIDDLALTSHRRPLIIKRTWCSREYTNRGIISNLYRFIYNELKYALISDIEQSPETIKIWDRLRSAWDIKMINMKTKEITKINTTDLYGDSTYALIVESLHDDLYEGAVKDHVFELNGY
jgi:hypothetical protein